MSDDAKKVKSILGDFISKNALSKEQIGCMLCLDDLHVRRNKSDLHATVWCALEDPSR